MAGNTLTPGLVQPTIMVRPFTGRACIAQQMNIQKPVVPVSVQREMVNQPAH
jgi:hypothetical protein